MSCRAWHLQNPENKFDLKKELGIELIDQLEEHTVEHVPLPGWTVYILCSTDRSDLNQDFNQNQIGLVSSRNQLIHRVLA